MTLNKKKYNGKFLKTKKWKISIMNMVYQYLISIKDSFPNKLKWDNLLFLISRLEYKIISSLKKNPELKFIEITSDELKFILHNYKKYIQFLIDHDILSVKNYSTTAKRCNAYRINYQKIYKKGYRQIDMAQIDMAQIDISSNNNLCKKNSIINTPYIESCIHLTKWLDEGFEFDKENFESIGFKINLNINDNNFDIKPLSYIYKIQGIINKDIRYSRDPEKDYRLHSYLTNFPSKLRNFLTYKGNNLISFDLKNSQPFFAIVFIDGFINNNIRTMNIYKKIYNIGIISKNLEQTLYSKEFQEEYSIIKEWIINGDFYEELSNYLDIEIDKKEYYIYNYEKSCDCNRKLTFDTKRDATKKIAMKLLYSPNKKNYKIFMKFKSRFPNFWNFLDILKNETTDKNSYKKLPKLLQHIEANCIIDFVTKKIAKDYPNMPLFTIHDSIATIPPFYEILLSLMNKYISEYTNGIIPNIKYENWELPFDYSEAA